MQRWLLMIGGILLVLGLLWPWLVKSGLGRLPGDFYYEGNNLRFYFPLTTGILISAVVSLLLWLFRR